MSNEIRTWEVKEQGIQECKENTPKEEDIIEEDLHRWIEEEPEIVHKDMRVLGSYVPIGGKELDILGFMPDNSLAVVELKIGETSRKVVAQAIDYASRLAKMDKVGLDSLSEEVEDSLGELFEEEKIEGYSDIKEEPMIFIVAPELDNDTKNMIDYLSEMYEVPINGVMVSYAKLSDDTEILNRTRVVSEEEMEERLPSKGTNAKQLEKIAKEKGIQEEVKILRRAKEDFLYKESSKNQRWGRAFRYWGIDGKDKVIFGIKVEKSQKGAVEIWVNRKWPDELLGIPENEVVNEIENKFTVVGKTKKKRVDVKIKNSKEAKKFVRWLENKVTE